MARPTNMTEQRELTKIPVTQIPQNKEYAVPTEMAAEAPVVHANHVQMTASPDSVALVFCVKMDTVSTDINTVIAAPQITVFMGIPTAINMIERMSALLDHLKNQVRLSNEAGLPKK